ncbi:MAG TPA: condensation domain-containing protein, partial [Pilimelia sp.]|nr:condensation domain-containing protein [Pilimelia sp.]
MTDPDAERFAPFPLTDQQHAYVVGRTGTVELGNVSTHAYYEYEGDLDLDRFRLAWQRAVDRHDMLRAVIDVDAGTQRVLESVPPFAPEVVDLRGLPAGEVARRLAGIRDGMSHEVRPAGAYPLFGVVVSRLDDRRARVHVSFDGLTLDYLSWQLLVADLTAWYDDPDHAAAPLGLTFRDYVLAADAARDTEPYRRARRYWA